MNTNQMTRNTEQNLSVTASSQNDPVSNNTQSNNAGQSKSSQNIDNSYGQTHQCAGGICSTTWKPHRQNP